MPTFQDFFRLSINLDSTPAVASKFTVPLVMVDHADIPIDVRVRQVTPATWATRLTASSEAYNWFSKFYSEPYPMNPVNSRNNVAGYVGRWVSSASKAYRVFPNAGTTVATWVAAAGAGKFKITDGTNTEDIDVDFTDDTDMDDVAASIQAGLAAGTNFTGYTCSIDALDRLIISGSATGASAPSFTLATPDSGTDLTGATFLANASSFLQAGLDAEAMGASAAAVFVKDNTPTVVFQRGLSDVQALAFLTAMDAIEGKFTVIVTTDTDHEDSEATTTLAYQAYGLEFSKAHIIYSRQGDYVDAARYGENLPQPEGTVDYALWPFTGVSQSGFELDGVTPAEVSAAAVEALDAVNCDFVTKPHTKYHLARGLCPNGDEVRIVLLKMWAEYNASLEGYQYFISNEVNTFSEITLGGIKGILQKYLDECVTRRGIEEGYVLNMPSAADFTAAQKASHVMTLSDVASAGIQFAVNSVIATMNWSAQ